MTTGLKPFRLNEIAERSQVAREGRKKLVAAEIEALRAAFEEALDNASALVARGDVTEEQVKPLSARLLEMANDLDYWIARVARPRQYDC